MPILIQKDFQNAQIYLFRAEESVDYFFSNLDFTESDLINYHSMKHPEKKKQWLASRYLLKKVSGQNRTLYMQKSSLGKPSFSNIHAHFSISHSRDYIGIIYSKDRKVAIDIEKIQPKVVSIRKKFLHPEEYHFSKDEKTSTLLWSAKEAIYKHYHTAELYSFKENIIAKTITESTLNLDVVLKSGIVPVELNYFIECDIVVVYMIE